MGVPPVPIVTEPLAVTLPLAATSHLLSTLNFVTPALWQRRMFPALPAALLLNMPAATLVPKLAVTPTTPVPLPLLPMTP